MTLMTRDRAFYKSFGRLILGLMLEQVAVLSVNLIDLTGSLNTNSVYLSHSPRVKVPP